MFHVIAPSGTPSGFFRYPAMTLLALFLATLCTGCVHLKPGPPITQSPPVIQETADGTDPTIKDAPAKEIPVKDVTEKTAPVNQEPRPDKAANGKKNQTTASPEIKRSLKKATLTKRSPHNPRYVIGEVEPVTIKAAGMTLPARIDTGAQTSSLGASDISPYERDGEKWVRFTVTLPGSRETKTIERPVSRMVKIKRHGGEALRRYSVKLEAVLGSVEKVREFTLTDRSAFKYPILIGRNFLDGIFMVDVSLRYSTSPFSEVPNNEK